MRVRKPSFNNILTESEINEARIYLSSNHNSLEGALQRFKNSLALFINLYDDNADRPLTHKIYALDTTEFLAAFSDNQSAQETFCFNQLFNTKNVARITKVMLPFDDKIINFRVLDQLILQQLIKSNSNTPLLLDPFAQELSEQEVWLQENFQRIIKMGDAGRLQGMSTEQLERLEAYVVGQLSGTAADKEWDLFRKTFLPSWRENLLIRLSKTYSTMNNIRSFIHHGSYMYLRSDAVLARSGVRSERSIENYIKNILQFKQFDFLSFSNYFNKEDIRKEYKTLVDQIFSLLLVRRGSETSDSTTNSLRDAEAIVQAHLTNSFFASEGLDIQVEIVSRAPSMLDLMAALPRHKLRVLVRHPLLIPEIYSFNNKALQSISEILLAINNTISLLDSSALNNSDSSIDEACGQAYNVVKYLADITVSQQTSSLDAEIIGGTSKLVFNELPAYNRINAVSALFSAIKHSIDDGNDKFAQGAWADTISYFKDLLNNRKYFNVDHVVKLHVILVPDDNSIMPNGFISIRVVEPYHGTSFNVYSNSISALIKTRINREYGTDFLNDKASPASVIITFEINIISEFIVDLFDIIVDFDRPGLSYFSSAEIDAGRSSSTVDGLSAVLVLAMIFSALGELEAAMSLLIAALRPAIKAIRDNLSSLSHSVSNIEILLCLRELFLLRHRCERDLALLRSENPLLIGHVENSQYIPINFARAQRDLDLATLISEHVEFCIVLVDRDDLVHNALWAEGAPTGSVSLKDERLHLNHVNGWLDQFVVLGSDVFTSWSQTEMSHWSRQDGLSRRLALWTMAGYAKELSASAFRVRRRVLELPKENLNEREYLLFVEASLLESAILYLISIISFLVAPDARGYIISGGEPSVEKGFVFRDWRHWWMRYSEIRELSGYGSKMGSLIDPICEAISAIQSGSNSVTELGKLREKMNFLVSDISNQIIVRIIASQMLDRIEEATR